MDRARLPSLIRTDVERREIGVGRLGATEAMPADGLPGVEAETVWDFSYQEGDVEYSFGQVVPLVRCKRSLGSDVVQDQAY